MTIKIGRNTPCPCGSGKKYKKCCINTLSSDTSSELIGDDGSLWHARCIADGFLEGATELSFLKLFDSFLDSIGIDSLCNITHPENFFCSFLKNIEKLLEEIIRKYSFYELLYWTRRIAPMNPYSLGERTIYIYREVLQSAIAKYGSSNINYDVLKNRDIKFFVPEYISNLNPLSDDIPEIVPKVLRDCYYIEGLSAFYVYGTQRNRILNKGGVLVKDPFWGFDVSTNDEISFLIDLYDERLSYNNLLSVTGSFFDESGSQLNNNYAFSFRLNIDLREQFPIDLKINSKNMFSSNYIPMISNLEDYYEYLNLFKDEFEHLFHFTVDDFIVYITSLSLRSFYIFINDVGFRYSLLQRAYTIYENKTEILQYIGEYAVIIYQKKFGYLPENYEERLQKIFTFLSCETTFPRDIDLWTCGPRKLYYPITAELGAVDYSGIYQLLYTLMLPISRLDGDPANRRSKHFEDKTNNLVKETFGIDSFWIGQRKINNGSGSEKEIDSSFFVGQYLFVLECKSVNVSFGFEKGDKKALEFRKVKNEEFLGQLEEKVSFIIDNYTRLSTAPPQGIKYIIPILVSPFAEYIWEHSEWLFLDHNLPRILTLKELVKIKEYGDLSFLNAKPFTRTL